MVLHKPKLVLHTVLHGGIARVKRYRTKCETLKNPGGGAAIFLVGAVHGGGGGRRIPGHHCPRRDTDNVWLMLTC